MPRGKMTAAPYEIELNRQFRLLVAGWRRDRSHSITGRDLTEVGDAVGLTYSAVYKRFKTAYPDVPVKRWRPPPRLCRTCGNPCPYNSRRREYPRYCSLACRPPAHGARVLIYCHTCSTPFSLPASYVNRARAAGHKKYCAQCITRGVSKSNAGDRIKVARANARRQSLIDVNSSRAST